MSFGGKVIPDIWAIIVLQHLQRFPGALNFAGKQLWPLLHKRPPGDFSQKSVDDFLCKNRTILVLARWRFWRYFRFSRVGPGFRKALEIL